MIIYKSVERDQHDWYVRAKNLNCYFQSIVFDYELFL